MPECEQPSYSQYTPLPSTSHPSTSAKPETSFLMTLRETILEGFKSRSQEHATRVSSGDFTGDGEVEIEDPTVYKVYKRRWLGVAIIMLLNIVSSWSWIAFAPVADFTRDYFGLSSSTPVNWLSTVVLFVYCVLSPVTAYVYHHHGVRLGLIIGAVLTVVGAWFKYGAARTSPPSFSFVMVGQIISGMGQPFVLNIPTHYSDKWFSATSRVSATALMSLANAIGAAVGQLVNPFLAPNVNDIPSMLLYFAIIASVVCAAAPFTPANPPSPPAPSTTAQKLHLMESLRALLPNYNFWFLFVPFAVYVGFFNAFSTLLQQFMNPWGYSNDDAGIAGAVLILAGLVVAAITSPLIDRFHAFLPVARVLVTIVSISYLVMIWVIRPSNYAAICVICAVLGAASFSLLPLALELAVELTHPIPPEVSAAIFWIGGEFLGGVFVIIMDALRDDSGVPRFNMVRALIFEGIVACVAVPFLFLVRRRAGRLGTDVAARYH